MTTLYVDELKNTLEQNFTFSGEGRRRTITGLRPYIYMHNAPSGTFTLSFKSGATTLASETFTSAVIKSDLSTSNNYAHIYKALEFDPFVVESGTFTVELSASGYSFSESSYLGWIRRFESIPDTINFFGDYPRYVEVFERLRRVYS